jgi:hypothetical protein
VRAELREQQRLGKGDLGRVPSLHDHQTGDVLHRFLGN